MASLSEYEGKIIALLMMAETEDGEEDWVVFTGYGQVVSGALQVDRGPDNPPIGVRDEWLERLQPVKPGFEETLCNADYLLPLSVGELAADEDVAGLEPLGLKWPDRAG